MLHHSFLLFSMSFQFFLNKKPAEMIGQTIWQIFLVKMVQVCQLLTNQQ